MLSPLVLVVMVRSAPHVFLAVKGSPPEVTSESYTARAANHYLLCPNLSFSVAQ